VTKVAIKNGKAPAAVNQLAEYKPLGQSEAIRLTAAAILKYCATPTRSGKMPEEKTILKFAATCKASRLNPLSQPPDAWLLGYDSQSGASWSIITSIGALFKRADHNRQYNGMKSGVIVRREDGSIENVDGEFFLETDTLVGGWAEVFRKDREVSQVARIKLETYSTGRSHWAKDPARMITKCAEAAALRKAFPNETAGLYVQEEEGIIQNTVEPVAKEKPVVVDASESRADQLSAMLESNNGEEEFVTEDEILDEED